MKRAHIIASLLRRPLGLVPHRLLSFVLPMLCAFGIALFYSSCSKDDDEVYPDIVNEMADMYTNSQGSLMKLVLDNGRSLDIENKGANYPKKVIYRVLCGFTEINNKAHIYQLTSAYLLRDSSTIAKQDPTGVLSTWRTERYINLHLAAKTQGGKQHWGFVTDSIVSHSASDGSTTQHAYVSLHHNQNNDPTSYTQDVYASLPIDSIKGISKTDPITLRINTFNGIKEYEFK